MKKTIIAACLVSVLSIAGFSQKQKTSPDDTATPEKPAKNSKSRPSGSGKQQENDGFLNVGTMLDAQLQSTLDVRKAQPGDQVVLKTVRSIKQNGQMIVPKGTELIGRVTEVQQRTSENGASKIGLIFEKLQGKDLAMPLTASIVSITNVAGSATVADDLFSSDLAGSSSTSTRASGGSGGGLLGGVTNTVGGATGGLTNTLGGVTNTATQTLGTATNAATGVAGNASGSLIRTVNGIQISNSVSGSAQGATTLSAPNKNIKVETGATFHLQVAN